ncbi:unnamed protein product [Urochloa humidicola]
MAAGGDDVQRPPLAQAAARLGRRRHQAASIPLDVMADMATRTDPVTLVRCAATCIDLRGRVADPAFRHADCFVPSFLRGHLEIRNLNNYRGVALHLVDITAGRRHEPRATASSSSAPPTGSRLLMSSACATWSQAGARPSLLSQRSPTLRRKTGSSIYVLLVGDGAAIDGIRPFQVVNHHS